MGIWGKSYFVLISILLVIILCQICSAEPRLFLEPKGVNNDYHGRSPNRWNRPTFHTYTSNSTSLTFLELKSLVGSNYEAFHFPKLKNLSVRKTRLLSEWLSCTELSIGADFKFKKNQFELLAKSNVDIIDFPFVRMLTDEQAEMLFKSKARTYYLDSLKSISASQAHLLISKQWGHLSLNGLEVLNDWVAQELVKFDGCISLSGLRLVSPESAITLINKQGRLLPLLGITELTYEQATTLAELEVQALILSDIKQLPHEQIAILSRSRAYILKLGLDTLTVRHANLLSKFGTQNSEILNWYKLFEEKCADGCDRKDLILYFSTPVAGISFDGLENISDSVAAIISQTRCVSMYFPKLKTLTEFQAKCFGDFVGVTIKMPSLDPSSYLLYRKYQIENGMKSPSYLTR